MRTLAILAVVIFHVNPGLVSNGFLGVDVFFAISGYLITSILRRDLEIGAFSMARFWFRRARRILPALCVVLLGTAIGGYLLLAGPDRQLLGLQTASTLGFVSNLFMLKSAGDYWGPVAEYFPLLHTWSLSLEEQYYLVFPIALAWVWNRWKARVVAVTCGVFTASLLLNLVGGQIGSAWSFYLLPSRGWQLLAGALVALMPLPPAVSAGRRLSLWADFGVVLIIVSFGLPLAAAGAPVIKGLFATAGAALFLAFGQQGGVAAAILSSRPMVYIGKVSYSWYLWHWPFLVLGRLLPGANDWLLVSFALGMAILTYHAVEKPTRRISDDRILGRVVIPCLVLCPFVLLPLFTLQRIVIPHALPTKWCDAELRPRRDAEQGCVPSGLAGNQRDGLKRTEPIPGPLRAIVLGDSHAKAWLPGLDAAFLELGWNYTAFPAAATSPFLASPRTPIGRIFYGKRWPAGDRLEFDRDRKAYLASTSAPVVVVAARWSNCRDWSRNEFREAVADLIAAVPRSRVVFLGQAPELPFGSAGFHDERLEIGRWTRVQERSNSRHLRERIHLWIMEYAREEPRVSFVDIASEFTSPDGIRLVADGRLLYIDDDHISVDGALSCVRLLTRALVGVIQTGSPERGSGFER